MKSVVLTAVPDGVVTVIRPEPPAGTVVIIFVAVDALTVAFEAPKVTLSFESNGSKLVPTIVTPVPGPPMTGVNPVIVGAAELPTVNGDALVTESSGVVIIISPVVA